MEDSFLYDAGFDGSRFRQSNELDEMTRHMLSMNAYDSEAFNKGLKAPFIDEAAAKETIEKWKGYESFA